MKELRELEKKCYVIADRLTKPEATPTDTYNVVKELITLIRTATLDEVMSEADNLCDAGGDIAFWQFNEAIDKLRGSDET